MLDRMFLSREERARRSVLDTYPHILVRPDGPGCPPEYRPIAKRLLRKLGGYTRCWWMRCQYQVY